MERYTIDPESQHPNSLALFGKFSIFRTSYKLISDQPIHAFFIVPDQLPSGPRPLLVRFHGGGGVEGEAEASIRPFFLELALKHGAVILTPDYRLRPEHEAADGIEDVKSFWQWIEDGSAHGVLSASLPSLTIDTNNLMVAGESYGGYLTAQTALLGMTSLPIKVLFIQYPALNMTEILRVEGISEEILKTGTWAERIPYSEVEDYLRDAEKGKLRTRATFGTRMRLCSGLVQAGKFWNEEKDAALLCPTRTLDHAGKMPPILLYHSKEDEAVPWQHTEAWAAKLKRLQPEVPLHLSFQKGDHVFDKNDTMAAPWLEGPLEFVQGYWPEGKRA